MKSVLETQVPPKGGVWAAYYRVSTEEQADSLQPQREAVRNYVAKAGGILAFEFEDVGTGLRVNNRPDYLDFLEVIENRKVTHIAARDFMRFGRRMTHIWELWDLCQENNVLIYDTQLNNFTLMHVWAFSIMAQMYSNVLSEQVKASMISRLIRGLRNGGRIYGYVSQEKTLDDGRIERGHYEPVPHEVEVIRRIFDYVDRDDLGVSAIKRNLIREGIHPSPLGAVWSVKTITYILLNEFYRRRIIINRVRTYYRGKQEICTQEERPADEWLDNPNGSHQGIIDPDQFERVGEKVRAAMKPRATKVKFGPPRFLSGLLKCSHCSSVVDGQVEGGTMVVSGEDNGKKRLRCERSKNDKCTNTRSHYRHEVIGAVLQSISELLQSPEAAASFLEERNREVWAGTTTKKAKRAEIERELRKLEAKIGHLNNSIEAGAPANTVIPRLRQRETERLKLKEQLEGHQEEKECTLNPVSIERYLEICKFLQESLSKNPADPLTSELAELLEALVRFVLVTPKPDGRGFQVEVYGTLAQLVAGKESVIQAHNPKSPRHKGTRKSRTLQKSKLDPSLHFIFAKKRVPANRPSLASIESCISGRTKPVLPTTIVKILAAHGISRRVPSVYRYLKARPDQFIHVRGHGFISRVTMEGMQRKPLLDEAHINEQISSILKAEESLRPDEILQRLDDKGFALCGTPLERLRTFLTNHRNFYQAHGRNGARWSLR